MAEEVILGLTGIEDKEFPCKEEGCSESFATSGAVKTHFYAAHGRTDLRCSYCNLNAFVSEESYHSHMDFHSPEDPLKCQKCGKYSKDKKALWRHVRESHREEKSVCKICKAEFTRSENLKVHMNTVHAETREAIYSCKECDKSYKLRRSLRNHMKIQHREIPLGIRYSCQICSKEYDQICVLQTHMKYVHSDQRNFICDICEVSYKNNSHLKRHLDSLQHESNVKAVETGGTLKKGLPGSGKNKNTKKVKKQTKVVDIGSSDDDDDELPEASISASKPPETEPETGTGTTGRPSRRSKTTAKKLISKYVTNETEIESVIATKTGKNSRETIKAIGRKRARKSESAISDPAKSADVVEYFLKSGNDQNHGFVIQDLIKIEDEFIHIPDFNSDSEIEEDSQLCMSNPPLNPVRTQPIIDVSTVEEVKPFVDSDDEECENPTHFCIHCEKGFGSLESVRRHEGPCRNYLKSRKLWICSICGKQSFDKHQLKRHQGVHYDERKFKCHLCPSEVTYKSASALRSHINSVHKGKPSAWSIYKQKNRDSPCTICGKVMSCPKNLRRHIEEVHPPGGLQEFKCAHCPKVFKTMRFLNIHLKEHADKNRFSCRVCQLNFTRMGNFKIHLKGKRHIFREKEWKKGRVRKQPKHNRNNMLLLNIPEKDETADKLLVERILWVLHPKHRLLTDPTVERLGVKDPVKRRPLRVMFPSVHFRNVCLISAHLLKDHKEWENVRIRKDYMEKPGEWWKLRGKKLSDNDTTDEEDEN